MASLIHTYALIKALYDEGQDYLDSFWPFVVEAMPSNQSVTSRFIQKRLRKRFDFEVPLHVLGVILTRAERRKYIRHWRDTPASATKYRLTEDGLSYSTKLETSKAVDRRINALLESMMRFFEGKGVSLSSDRIHELLLFFLRKNIDFLIERINPSIRLIKMAQPDFGGSDRYLLEYIESAEQNEPDNYRILEDMVFGLLVSVLLYVDDPEEIAKIRTTRFDDCQVFLDTNFVFSLLGLHAKEFNEPARELLDLLKKHHFNLKAFSFTVDEICRVVNSYHKEYHRYPTNIRVNTLYSSLKVKGWSKMDAREFIINIEQILQDKGIAVEWMRSVNLDRYTPDEGLRDAIKKYKPEQGEFNRNHDLAAIAKIKELRKQTIRRIENSKAFFLTSDFRLNRFNFLEEGHKQNGTICETVLDRLLTSILWLKNPNTKPPLKSIIAAHSRDLFVNRRVWDRFYQVLQKLKREGKIKDDDISTLFWHSYVEDALRSIEETETSKITPQFVLEKIEKAEKLREEAIEKRIKKIEKDKEEEMNIELRKKEKEFAESLEQWTSEVELRKEKEWLDKIQGIKESLRESSKTKASSGSYIYASILTLVYVAAVIVSFLMIPFEILDLALTAFGGGGLVGLWASRSKMRNWLFERTYRQKLEEAKLDESQ